MPFPSKTPFSHWIMLTTTSSSSKMKKQESQPLFTRGMLVGLVLLRFPKCFVLAIRKHGRTGDWQQQSIFLYASGCQLLISDIKTMKI
mmetsp:Transcript_1694/g.2613  ORF Transcript_1694/g.2613 Transcript_1694/m.2613 type:complete len:88 (-) Transcript_1694:124-387(-)